jgi:hypothetical protein
MTTIRKGQVVPFVPREVFRQRFQQSFYDPAFDAERAALDRIENIAWDAYKAGRKAPRTVKAGDEFADPDYELSVEWLEARKRVHAAAALQRESTTRTRVLLICGAARNDGSCPAEMSKSVRPGGARGRCSRLEPSDQRVPPPNLSVQRLRVDGDAAVPLAVQLLSQSCAGTNR